MEVDRTQTQLALQALPRLDMEPAWRDNLRIVLSNNLAFIDDGLARNVISYVELSAFAKKQAPYLAKNVAWGAQTQVAHWMSVPEQWKQGPSSIARAALVV
jgi:hypothetical protein